MRGKAQQPYWLTLDDPGRFWQSLYFGGRPRKVRLFACGCARRVWPLLTDIRSRHAVEASERYADGAIKSSRLYRARRNAESVRDRVHPAYLAMRRDPVWALLSAPVRVAGKDVSSLLNATNDVRDAVADGGDAGRVAAEQRAHVALLRDVFGNPFRPVTLDLAWRTSTAVALAAGMYENRDFSAMPILADALQDAGCDNPDVLNHCRGIGPHVRGCWVVDLVLGKG